MSRHNLISALHWALFAVLLVMTEGGQSGPAISWLFAGLAGAFALQGLALGPKARPGPSITGRDRPFFRPIHGALYLACAVAAGAAIAGQTGLLDPAIAYNFVVALFGIGLLHGVYHLYRHTGLNDGALRNIWPRRRQS